MVTSGPWTVDEAEYHLLHDEPWKSIVGPKKTGYGDDDGGEPEGEVITQGRVTLVNLYSPAPGKYAALFEFDLETYSALMAAYSLDDQPIEWTVRKPIDDQTGTQSGVLPEEPGSASGEGEEPTEGS